MIEQAKEQGRPETQTFIFRKINHRLVMKCCREKENSESLWNLEPGSREPVHKLLFDEKEAASQMAKKEEYADFAHRILAATAWDLNSFFVSFTSVYCILHPATLMVTRGIQRRHNGRSIPPVRKEFIGPNQRWFRDISYLKTYEKEVFLYMLLLLDEYSRKAIFRSGSWHQTAEGARCLLEEDLISENILAPPEEKRPEIINDTGRPMKARPIKRMFEDHHMSRLFAGQQAHSDNPFVESLFSNIKRAYEYPDRFLNREQAVEYFY